jgi:lipopolysaccharide export system protein LptA
MRRSWLGALGTVLVLTAAPAAAMAQQGRSCRQVLPADARRLVNSQGEETYYFLDPVRVLCTGDVRLEADSAVMNRAAGTVILVGDVVYQDSTRQLTADWANYLGGREQLLARGSVNLRDLEGGAVVTGEQLDYRRETADRPEALMIVREGRPHAVIPSRRTPGETPDPDSLEAPTEVWAERMEFEGDSRFLAEGNVEIQRGQTSGGGDTGMFDQLAEQMTLIGAAHVEDARYRLEGQRIDAFLADDQIREVNARTDARVESDELDVTAQRIRIAFEDGRLRRMEAWNPSPAATARARAVSEGFRLRADSIDALADSIGVREVRAVGRAYGERAADSVAVGLPTVAVRDWIQGDTIIGFFAEPQDSLTAEAALAATRAEDPLVRSDQVPDTARSVTARRADAAPDTAEVVLERIVVIGGEGAALSLYRLRGENPGDPPAVNFMKAARIVLFMEEGDVARVEAEGPIEGVYLNPVAEPSGEGGEGEPVEGPS